MIYSIVLFSNLFFRFLEIIWTLKIFNNFLSSKISIFQMVILFFFQFSKLLNFENSLIFEIEQFRIFDHFSN